MLIDWFTVCAQALNFLILVWLLKRFLYRPILDAIDARERLIAAELADAAAKQAEAQRARCEYSRRSDELDAQRSALLEQAKGEAEALRQRLASEARIAAEAEEAKLRLALAGDAVRLKEAIAGRTGREVVAIVRKALGDLASATLEERLVEVLVRRVRELDAAARQDIIQALQAAPGRVLIRSAFALTAEQRAALATALAAILPAPFEPAFETRPELVCGIEMIAGGRKVAWSIADYLASMERDVAGLMGARAHADRPAQPPPAALRTAVS